MSKFEFTTEHVLPPTDPKSPYYVNLPSHDAKPIDNLVCFFKYWKYFIKSLIHYLKEISLVKEFEANLNYQLLSAIQFPGFKDLPRKVINEISAQSQHSQHALKEGHNGNTPKNLISGASGTHPPTTPTKDKFNSQAATASAASGELKRPGLLKTKSNNSTFLKYNKENPEHKRTSLTSKVPSTPQGNQPSNDIKIQHDFFPDDALFTNLPPLVLNHHQLSYQVTSKLHRDLNSKIIPRLEILLKNLSNKIKEIKSSLKNDSFGNYQLAKEISETGIVLREYRASVETYSSPVPVLKKVRMDDDEENVDEDSGVLDDPFLIKLRVDYQVKHQLIHENYMFASYVNLQNISKDLFTYVMKELSVVIDKFGKLELNPNFYKFLKEKISVLANSDWEYFISMNPNFLNVYRDTPVQKKKEMRTFKTITLPYEKSIHNKCIRYGILYKKSKLLKKYSRCFYVLTCNYLHEFKIEADENGDSKLSLANAGHSISNAVFKKHGGSKDKIGGFIGHDDEPVKSYNLNDCSIAIKDEKGMKFQLIKNSNSNKKYTFKCSTVTDFNNWYVDLEELFRFGSQHYKRFELLQAKIEVKEQEQKRAKELKQKAKEGKGGKENTTPPVKSSNNLSTGSIKENFNLSFNNSDSLTGIFTPTIRTPVAGSPEDGNPFDQTFMNGISQHANLSTNTVGSTTSLPALNPSQVSPTWSPGDSGSTFKIDASAPHDAQHQTYLQMQQEILKHQQDLLSQKINELRNTPPATDADKQLGHSRLPSETSNLSINPMNAATINNTSNNDTGARTPPVLNLKELPGARSPPNLNLKDISRTSSVDSMHSFVISQTALEKGVQAAFEAGQKLASEQKKPDSETPSGTKVPELLVSSNH